MKRVICSHQTGPQHQEQECDQDNSQQGDGGPWDIHRSNTSHHKWSSLDVYTKAVPAIADAALNSTTAVWRDA